MWLSRQIHSVLCVVKHKSWMSIDFVHSVGRIQETIGCESRRNELNATQLAWILVWLSQFELVIMLVSKELSSYDVRITIDQSTVQFVPRLKRTRCSDWDMACDVDNFVILLSSFKRFFEKFELAEWISLIFKMVEVKRVMEHRVENDKSSIDSVIFFHFHWVVAFFLEKFIRFLVEKFLPRVSDFF